MNEYVPPVKSDETTEMIVKLCFVSLLQLYRVPNNHDTAVLHVPT